jgi:hypothetical protein
MAMRGRLRMLGISLVDMLRRYRRQGDVRRQDQAENDPPAGLSHALMIMATGRTARQTGGRSSLFGRCSMRDSGIRRSCAIVSGGISNRDEPFVTAWS